MSYPVRHKPLFKTPRKPSPEKGRKWSVFRILGKALKRTCTALGALMLISLLISSLSLFYFSTQKVPPLPDDMVLLLPVEGPFLEKKQLPTLRDPFPTDRLTIQQVVDALRYGARDDRVKGVLMDFRAGGIGLAQVQEIRGALKDFRQSGKFVKAYSQSFGSTGNSFSQYYLASAATEIWMQPVGSLTITGLSAELPFAKDSLAKLGIKPEFIKRKEFKSAVAPLTDSALDQPTEEMLTSIIEELGQQFVTDVARDRDLSERVVKDLLDVGMFLGEEARSAGLIDKVGYGDVLVSMINETVMGDPESRDVNFVSMNGFLSRAKREKRESTLSADIQPEDKPVVALIHVNGAIVPRVEAVQSPLVGIQGMASAKDISEAIYKASRMEDVDVIVLRVDSPGGSPTASEAIRRAVEKAKERDKKIVVSMASTAASGGYWIIPDADVIYALPATLTGSIGVVGGKIVLEEMWQKLGINWAQITFGESAGMWSPNDSFEPAELERFNTMMDFIYDEFVSRVAQGRGMEYAEAEKIARGRAWTGTQAKQIGLVDKLGGLHDALNEAAVLAGAQGREDISVIKLPKEKKFTERLIEILQQQVRLGEIAGVFGSIMSSREFSNAAMQIEIMRNPFDYSVYSDFGLR